MNSVNQLGEYKDEPVGVQKQKDTNTYTAYLEDSSK